MAGKLAFLCAQNVNIFAKCHIFHIAAGAPAPHLLLAWAASLCPVLFRLSACPPAVHSGQRFVYDKRNVVVVVSAGGCGTTCCNGHGNDGVVVVVVGNWRPPSALTSPETSFRSRIDLERVSAL